MTWLNASDAVRVGIQIQSISDGYDTPEPSSHAPELSPHVVTPTDTPAAVKITAGTRLAGGLSVNDLLDVCANGSERSICSSFLAGIVNAADYFNGKLLIEHGLNGKGLFCVVTRNLSEKAVEARVLSSLKKNKDRVIDKMSVSSFPASMGVFFAMVEAYPCDRDHPM